MVIFVPSEPLLSLFSPSFNFFEMAKRLEILGREAFFLFKRGGCVADR